MNFKSFSRSLKQSFLIEGQNNFGNKIPFRFVSVCSQGKGIFPELPIYTYQVNDRYNEVKNLFEVVFDFLNLYIIALVFFDQNLSEMF